MTTETRGGDGEVEIYAASAEYVETERIETLERYGEVISTTPNDTEYFAMLFECSNELYVACRFELHPGL